MSPIFMSPTLVISRYRADCADWIPPDITWRSAWSRLQRQRHATVEVRKHLIELYYLLFSISPTGKFQPIPTTTYWHIGSLPQDPAPDVWHGRVCVRGCGGCHTHWVQHEEARALQQGKRDVIRVCDVMSLLLSALLPQFVSSDRVIITHLKILLQLHYYRCWCRFWCVPHLCTSHSVCWCTALLDPKPALKPAK